MKRQLRRADPQIGFVGSRYLGGQNLEVCELTHARRAGLAIGPAPSHHSPKLRRHLTTYSSSIYGICNKTSLCFVPRCRRISLGSPASSLGWEDTEHSHFGCSREGDIFAPFPVGRAPRDLSSDQRLPHLSSKGRILETILN
jgi:hypothetical protein